MLQGAFRVLIGEESQMAIVASTLGIASLFEPLRRRVHAFIDRLFYCTKYDARKTLEAFSAKLRDETDLDALSEDLVRVVIPFRFVDGIMEACQRYSTPR